MSRDSSLDDFLPDETGDDGAESEDADDGPTADPPDQAEANAADADGESVDGDEGAPAARRPANSTFDWSPAGAACDRCGETVDRRWRDDGDLVCGGCKEW